MGFDVYGTNPTSRSGEYFRNSYRWWLSIWRYCLNMFSRSAESKPTFSELASKYLDRQDIRESTKSVRRWFLKLIVEILGNRPYDMYTHEDGKLLRSTLLSRGLYPETVNRVLRFAQQVLLHAGPKHLWPNPFSLRNTAGH
jgi:hypothetical protein